MAQLRSAGGPSAGRHLLAHPDGEPTRFDDTEWKWSLRWRAGLPVCTAGGECCHRSRGAELPCGYVLDSLGEHAVCCEKGPWRVQRHDNIADELRGYMQAAGATAVREFPFPELRGPTGREAVLDIWSSGSAWLGDRVIDVTVRHPCAQDALASAAAADGACAADAEREKQRRYPPSGGISVVTFAVETFGRLGGEAESLLTEAAAAASRRNLSRGHPAGRPLSKWRATLSALVAKAVVRSLRSAQSGVTAAGAPAASVSLQ